MLEALVKLDLAIFQSINTGLGNDALDGLMRFLSDEKLWVFSSLMLFVYAFTSKSTVLKKYCGVLAIAVFISDMVSFRVLKPWFQRQRPCYQVEDVRLVSDSCGSEYGFPSNHAANGFAIAVSFHWFIRKRWALSLYPVAVIVGLTRVYLGVHFPFDVLFGFSVGLIGGLLAVQIFRLLEILYERYKLAKA